MRLDRISKENMVLSGVVYVGVLLILLGFSVMDFRHFGNGMSFWSFYAHDIIVPTIIWLGVEVVLYTKGLRRFSVEETA